MEVGWKWNSLDQIIDITMPKIWQVMVSIILINFEHEDHEGDGPFKTEMNWVLELLLLLPFQGLL